MSTGNSYSDVLHYSGNLNCALQVIKVDMLPGSPLVLDEARAKRDFLILVLDGIIVEDAKATIYGRYCK